MALENNTTGLQNIIGLINELPEFHEPHLQDKTVVPSTDQQAVVADVGYDGLNSVTVEGDSNLVSENIKSGVSIFSVSGSYEGNGNTDIEDAFVTKTISTYENDRVTTIGDYAFYGYSSLKSINFPACTNIGSSAFFNCYSLASVSFPNCTSIGGNAFEYCSSLTSISFPKCTDIGATAFYYCSSLTSVNFPVCTIIKTSVFGYCTKLTSVSFPECTNINKGAFFGCKSLKSISFPACTSIGNSAFYSCYSLASVSFPACTNISSSAFYRCSSLKSANFPLCRSIASYTFEGCSSLATINFSSCSNISNNAFYSCYSLTSVSFPECTGIGGSAFAKCYNLISFYLTGSSRCILSNSNAFTSTPIGGYSTSAGCYGSIYVPQSLLASYQTATNWTYFSSRFVAYDAGTDGGNSGEIIEFTIAETLYQAEEGMTWSQWINSDYNTSGYYLDSENYVYNGENWVWMNEGTEARGEMGNKSIVSDYIYILKSLSKYFD